MRPGLGVRAWAALSLVYVIWGSTYLAIAVVIETMPPLIAAASRWIPAGILLYTISVRRGDRDGDRPTRRHWRTTFVIGAALCLGGNGLVSIAESRVTSGMAALLVATVPLFAASFEWLRYRARLTVAVVAGLVVGFAGTGILVRPQPGANGVDLVGAFTVLAASAIWAAGSLYARRADLPKRPLVATGMYMIGGGVALFVVGAAGGEIGRFDAAAVSGASLVALGYLAVFGSLVAFTAYMWTLRNLPTQVATTYAYINPLIAVSLGWSLRSEPVTATTIIGGLVIVAAVATIVTASAGAPGALKRERPDLATEELIV